MMKTMKIINLVILLAFSVNVFSQVKVKDTGKFIIGEDRTDDDLNNVLSASVFGPYGSYRYGGKLSFGDFGKYENYGWNVFIGEYGSYDSDRLWLHGKNGIYLTRGRGDEYYWLLRCIKR